MCLPRVQEIVSCSQVKPKTIELVFAASPPNMQQGVRAKIGWFRIRIMCQSETTLRSKSKDWSVWNQDNVSE